MAEVHVIQRTDSTKYALEVVLGTPDAGEVVLESGHVYTKSEADYRAILLSRHYGLDRDELPTKIMGGE